MEGLPSLPEPESSADDSDESSASKAKKKSPPELSNIFKAEIPAAAEPERPSSLWDKLIGEEKPVAAETTEEQRGDLRRLAGERLSELEVPLDPPTDEAARDMMRRVEGGTSPDKAYAEAAVSRGVPAEIATALLAADMEQAQLPVQPEPAREKIITTKLPAEGELLIRQQAERSAAENEDEKLSAAPAWAGMSEADTFYPSRIPLERWNYYRYLHHHEFEREKRKGEAAGKRDEKRRGEKRQRTERRRAEKDQAELRSVLADREAKLRLLVSEKAVRSLEKPGNRGVPPPERSKRPDQESRLRLSKPERLSQLGHAVIAAEGRPHRKPESKPGAKPNPHIETMSRAELLELSDTVIVEGTSLRRIYETHLIGEKALRYLVGEYLKGRDIRRELRHEMIEREIDFERDPQLRDRVHSKGDSAASRATIQRLIEAAGAADTSKDRATELAELDRRRKTSPSKKTASGHRAADTILITTIAALLAIIIVLLATRH